MTRRTTPEQEARRNLYLADQAIRDGWRDTLMPKYERALRHKGHWQQRVREAIQALKDYEAALAGGQTVARPPLPYMADDARQPDTADHHWRYLALGQGLEELYGCRCVFIPEDVQLELVDLWQLLEKPFWGYVHRVLDLREFQIQWLHLQDDLANDDAKEIGTQKGVPVRDEQKAAAKPTSEPAKPRNADRTSGSAPRRKTRTTQQEANVRARAILAKEPLITAKALAERIGCAQGLIPKLDAWRVVQDARKKGRKPKTTSFTRKTQAVTGREDPELQKLILEQQEDAKQAKAGRLYLSHTPKPQIRE
jgi:hypothetical protein